MAFIELKPTSTLFQYTSVDGFYGIVGSKKLWLSDLTHSNDPRDIILGVETLDEIVKSVRHNEFQGEGGLAISHIYAYARTYITSRNRLFTACFTPVDDDLNMWREYGAKGTGLCIGFRPRAINDMHGRIYGVRYVTDDVASSLRSTVASIFEPLRGVGIDAIKDLGFQLNISIPLISLIASIKHRSWEYEKEMRLTFAASRESKDIGIPISAYPDDTELYWEEPLKRAGRFGEVEYYAQPFGKFNKGAYDHTGAIEQVVIGHQCSMSEEDVRSLLTREGFRSFQVSRSKCLFR